MLFRSEQTQVADPAARGAAGSLFRGGALGYATRMSLRIALLGAGTVGRAVADVLAAEAESWGIELAGIAVRDLEKARRSGLERLAPVTTDAAALAARPDVDAVVELMGGLDPALEIVEGALKRGRPVVTANKLLLATFGARLDRKSTRLNSSHSQQSRMPSSA